MIDFHCHLDLYPDCLQILPRVASENIFTLVVTTSPRAWQITSEKLKGYNNIHIALGLHPEIVDQKANERELLLSLIPQTRFIGEVGLDGKCQNNTFELQKSILNDVFNQCENSGGRIISIHSRNATTDTLDLIERYPKLGTPVLHWFSGSQKELARAIDLGCWFSINPPMATSNKGKANISQMPKDKIMTETDGPFTMINGKRLYPWESQLVIPFLDQLWSSSEVCSTNQLKDNLKRLLFKASIKL
jgi:TatD DNase family protein